MSVQRQKAFTLIELLVVISAIVLLMAILMPALATARSQAQALVCRANLRQLSIANIGYATENDGFYVAAAKDFWHSVGLLRGGFHRWHGTRTEADEPFEPSKGPLAGYLANGQVKECPANPDFTEDSSISFEEGCGGYGYNMTYLGSRLWENNISSPDEAYAKTTNMTEVSEPAETLMFADTAFLKKGQLIEYSFAEPPFYVYNGEPMRDFYLIPSIHFRHRGCANISWADGHIGSKGIFKSKKEDIYDGGLTTHKLGWFEPVDNTLFDLK